MLPFPSVVLCLAFILGLLTTGATWGWWAIILAGLMAATLRWLASRTTRFPFAWRTGPGVWLWLTAIVVGLFASFYLQIRVPQPSSADISRRVDRFTGSEVMVTGTVKTMPRLTRSQKFQFQLQTNQVESDSTGGKLYVTVPLKQANTLQPGQRVNVTGFLYRPRRASIPKGFDFADQLVRQGIFAGLSGQQIEVLDQHSTWGWWAWRQRIVKSQARYLGDSEGPLVSAMVMGGRAVDLPDEIHDRFIQVGLAHALAASGFHVSLILATVLALTRPLTERNQAAVGCGALILFGFLSGFTPSVFRAVLMGIAGLFALVASRKTQPVGLLLLIAVILLFINPVWIWDLGFQLSFLATFGLVISVPTFMRVFDWLPPRLATLIAVPLAATLWTLPLQLYRFGVVPVYGVLANILATAFLMVLTIGGFISGIVAIVLPPVGSVLAALLYYPAHGLILLVQGVAELPGSTLALGTISVLQLLILYGLLLSGWLWPWWEQRWQGLLATGLVVIILPIWQVQTNRFQVTLFDTVSPPIMVIQQPGATLLLNCGDRAVASQSVIPFLQRQGVNRVELAIATASWPQLQSGWQTLLHRIPVTTISAGVGKNTNAMTEMLAGERSKQKVEMRSLQLQQPITLGQVEITFLRTQPAVVLMRIKERNWLLVTGQPNLSTWLETTSLPEIDVLWWVGKTPVRLPEQLKPEVIVFSNRDRRRSLEIPPSLATQASQKLAPQIFWTAREGAIQWTPEQEFRTTLSPGDQATEIF